MLNTLSFIILFFLNQVYALTLSGHVVNDYSSEMKKKHAPGTFIKLISWKDSKISRCLTYKTPLKNKRGSLYLLPNSSCELKDLKKNHLYISNIQTLSFVKEESRYLINYNDQKLVLEFPMEKGLDFLKEYFQKDASIKDGETCRMANAQCEAFKIDRCKECVSGIWSAFLNWKCGKFSQRMCGVISCGRKNQQACLKGLNNKNEILNCDQAKQFTYCRKGLQIICEGDGRVICR